MKIPFLRRVSAPVTGAMKRGWSNLSRMVGRVGVKKGVVPDVYVPDVAGSLVAVRQGVRFLGAELAKLPLSAGAYDADGAWVPADDDDAVIAADRWGGWTRGGRVATYETADSGLRRVVAAMAYHGFAAVWVERNQLGGLEGIWPLKPKGVVRTVATDGRVEYAYNVIAGGPVPRDLNRADLAIIEWEPSVDPGVLGESPLEACWPAIRAAAALDRWAAVYMDKGAVPQMVLEVTGSDVASLDELSDDALRRLNMMRNDSSRVMVAPPATKVHAVGDSAAGAQMLESRLYGVQEVCRLLGIEPVLLGDLSRATYSNFGQARRNFASTTLTELSTTIAKALSVAIWPRGDRELRFDLTDAVRQSRKDRWESERSKADAHRVYIESGERTINELRLADGMDPVAWGDEPPSGRTVRLVAGE